MHRGRTLGRGNLWLEVLRDDDRTGDGTFVAHTRVVDLSAEAERRRIERDVHDGAQPRLTSLSLQLGLAQLDVPEDSPAARPFPSCRRVS